MPAATPSPSLEQQRASPAAARGTAASPPTSSFVGGGHASARAVERPYYFPNQHQRNKSSESSNKQLPALPRDTYGVPGFNNPRGPPRITSGGPQRVVASGNAVLVPVNIPPPPPPPPQSSSPPAGRKRSSSSLSSAETQAGDPGSEPLPPPPPIPKPPRSARPTPRSSPNPAASAHSRSTSVQTRYLNMLLAVDKIPRMHNILAAFFTWIMLAGFIIFPASFTSSQDGSQHGPEPNGTLWTPLVTISAALVGIGILGMLWLGFLHQRNYIWLLNRLYMPGTLNGLAGVIATLTSVYAQHRGSWSPTAYGAIAVQVAVFVTCGVLFVLYNNLLLVRVKRQHRDEQGNPLRGSAQSRRGFLPSISASVNRIASKPAFAPGSVV